MAKGKSGDPIPALEWVAAGLGLVVALVLLGIVGREVIRGDSTDDVPKLSVQVEGAVAVPEGRVVRIVIANRSAQTAAAVQVEGKAGDETSSATIDYVPGHSQTRGGLMFREPAKGPPEVRVTGYELP